MKNLNVLVQVSHTEDFVTVFVLWQIFIVLTCMLLSTWRRWGLSKSSLVDNLSVGKIGHNTLILDNSWNTYK